MPLKNLIKKSLYHAGYYRLYRRLKGAVERRLIVLMYHDLVEDGSTSNGGAILEDNPSRSQFETHLRELARNHRVISLRQAIAEIKSGGLKADSVTITFDDAYQSICTIAHPLLEKYGLHATVFTVTGWINGEVTFWWRRLGDMIAKSQFAGLTQQKLEQVLSGGVMTFPSGAERDGAWRRLLLERVALHLRTMRREELWNHLDGLEQLFFPSGDYSPTPETPPSWDQIRELAGPHMEFAAHTRSHVNFRFTDLEEAEREIMDSKREIEEQLQCEVNGFAYPYGKDLAAYTRIEPILCKLGFDYAVNTHHGYNDDSSDLYELRRVSLPVTTSRALIGRELTLGFLRPNDPLQARE